MYVCVCVFLCVFVFKQKTAYELRISDWSSDVCSSDLRRGLHPRRRPHSVQVVKSRMPFQEKSSMEPTPRVESSSRSSMSSSVIALPLLVSGFRAPSAVPPEDSRLNQMLNQAVKRCRSEEHTSELQSLMRISYAVFCLKKKKYKKNN